MSVTLNLKSIKCDEVLSTCSNGNHLGNERKHRLTVESRL